MYNNWNDNRSNLNNDVNKELPRWFTKEGQNKINRLKAGINVTPEEKYFTPLMSSYIIGGYCNSTSNAYRSGSNGGSPY